MLGRLRSSQQAQPGSLAAPRVTLPAAPLMSVIVPTADDDLRLRWALEGLCAQTVTGFETIIVNDGGAPNTQHLVDAYRDRLQTRYLYLGPRTADFRAAAARNLGARHSTGDVLMFLDSDCCPLPGLVAEHLRLHAAATAQGQQILAQGVRRRLPLSRVQECETYDVAWLLENSGPYLHRHETGKAGPDDGHASIIGFNFSVPAGVFCAIGGFDERFVGWGSEDLDLGLRLRRAGLGRAIVEDVGDVAHFDHALRYDINADVAHLRPAFDYEHEDLVRNNGPLLRVTPP